MACLVPMEEPIVPTQITLKKYGLTRDQWLSIYLKQGGVCFICQKLPKTRRLNVDHFHERGFKKMSDSEKRKRIRALLCWNCNRYYMGRGITIEKAKRVVKLLEDFEKREFDNYGFYKGESCTQLDS